MITVMGMRENDGEKTLAANRTGRFPAGRRWPRGRRIGRISNGPAGGISI
jgi:hypothetical protein